MRVHGVLLAAGAGRRMGTPKALVRDEAGYPWLLRGIETLHLGGCPQVTVVLGAGAAEARELLVGQAVHLVVAEDWASGMSASLRAGLSSLQDPRIDAALVNLVDLPDVGPDVVFRVGQHAGRNALARATYGGVPGHPVLLGRQHWAGVLASAAGDRGARDYLATQSVLLVECRDLATGRDVDTPAG